MSEEVEAFEGGDRNLEARNQIDEQIRSLRQQILKLCVARNQLTPIATLPVEVLTKVFLLARDDAMAPLSWESLILSWVCRGWRNAALRLPELWNAIDIPHPDLMKTFLKRSRKRELAICLKNMQSKNVSAIDYAMKSFPRLHTLCLRYEVPGMHIRCGSGWKNHAPILQQLELKSFSLSENIFSGVYPSLHKVSLISCTVAWNQFPIPPLLTTLRIISPTTDASITEIVNVLQSLPHIECLELSEALADSPGPDNQPRVPLLDMRTFTLETEYCHQAIGLCSRITLPPSANIKFKLHVEEDNEFLDTILAIQASRSQESQPKWDIIGLTVQAHSKKFYWSYVEEDNLRSNSVTTDVEFIIDPDIANSLTTQNVREVCHALHFDHLTRLTIEGKLGYDAALWQHAFGTLPNLSNLSVRGQFAREFVRYLKEEAEKLVSIDQMSNPLGPFQHRPTFQQLECLTLANLRQTAPDYVDVTLLLWALGPRKIYLERLPKLVLEGAQLPDKLLASFSHVVEEVSQELVRAEVEENENENDDAGEEDDDEDEE